MAASCVAPENSPPSTTPGSWRRRARPPSGCATRRGGRPDWERRPSQAERDIDRLYPHLGHDALGENLLGLGVAVGDALLVGVAQELLERRPVRLDAVGEGVAVEQIAHPPRIG